MIIIKMIQKVITVVVAIAIIIKLSVMTIVIKVMNEIMLQSFILIFITYRLYSSVNKVAVFKLFKSLLNLFQIDGPQNEILF